MFSHSKILFLVPLLCASFLYIYTANGLQSVENVHWYSMSVLQGGLGLPVYFYAYMTNGLYLNLNIEINDLPELEVRILL